MHGQLGPGQHGLAGAGCAGFSGSGGSLGGAGRSGSHGQQAFRQRVHQRRNAGAGLAVGSRPQDKAVAQMAGQHQHGQRAGQAVAGQWLQPLLHMVHGQRNGLRQRGAARMALGLQQGVGHAQVVADIPATGPASVLALLRQQLLQRSVHGHEVGPKALLRRVGARHGQGGLLPADIDAAQVQQQAGRVQGPLGAACFTAQRVRIWQQGLQQLRTLQAGICQGQGAHGRLGPGAAVRQRTVRLQGRDVLRPVDAQIDLVTLAGPGPLAHACRTLAPGSLQRGGAHVEDGGNLVLGRHREEKNAAGVGFGQQHHVPCQVLQAICQLLRQHALGLGQGHWEAALPVGTGRRAAVHRPRADLFLHGGPAAGGCGARRLSGSRIPRAGCAGGLLRSCLRRPAAPCRS